MTSDDEVVEFVHYFDATDPFLAGEDAELDVVEVVERFTGSDNPCRRLVEAKGIDGFYRQIIEDGCGGKLATNYSSG